MDSKRVTPTRHVENADSAENEVEMKSVRSKTTSPTPSKASEAKTIDTKQSDAPQPDIIGSQVWHIDNFSKIEEQKLMGPIFSVGDFQWRLMFFPRGTEREDGEHMGIYLKAVKNQSSGAAYWECYVIFSLSICHSTEERKSLSRETEHIFCPNVDDFGFPKLSKFAQVADPTKGYLPNDRLTLEVKMRIPKNIPSSARKDVAYVGLRNQGATCYMNSLLQAMYHTCSFRRSVYQIPISPEPTNKNIPYALQKVFYQLQTSNVSVDTKQLTSAFGWNDYESFTQHDVQELNRVLCDNLEQKMKGTSVEGFIPKLYEGKLYNYIKCINVSYESKREESFYDLSLNVKGCKDIYESFKKYTEEEILEGENKYHAEGFGLQDAKKGVLFMKLPPVLYLQLKRFEYDPNYDCMVKVNDKYKFYKEISLDPYMSKDVDSTVPNTYVLKGILVHAGDVNGGHYYAFIQPSSKTSWYKFDDDRVLKVNEDSAFDESFGGEENTPGKKIVNAIKRAANAYLLIYMRKSELSEIMDEVKLEDIPEDLRTRLEYERAQEDNIAREQKEDSMNTTLKVATLTDFQRHKDVELVTYSHVQEHKIFKSGCIRGFKESAQKAFNIPMENQRYWFWTTRENRTSRVYRMFTPNDEETSLSNLFSSTGERMVFLEDVALSGFSDESQPTVLLFFKVYTKSNGLSFVTYSRIPATASVLSLLKIYEDHTTIRPNSLPELYEERNPSTLIRLDETMSIQDAGLIHGDIIVLNCKSQTTNLDDLQAHYEYLQGRVFVSFRHIEKPKEALFELEFSRHDSYESVTARVAERLKKEARKIRLTSHNTSTEAPKHHPIKSCNHPTISDMLSFYPGFNTAATDILYFEVLEGDVADLEARRNLKISIFNQRCEEVKLHKVSYQNTDTILTLKEHLGPMMTVPDPRYIRILEVWNSKITRVFEDSDPLSSINEHSLLRAEEVEVDAYQVDDIESKYIQVQHFSRTSSLLHPFGSPFLFIIRKNEKFSDIKERLLAKLGLTNETCEKWKFAVVSFGRADYINPERILFNYDFLHNNAVLGLEHSAPKLANTSRVADKPIKLYN